MPNHSTTSAINAALQEFRPKWTLDIIHQAFNGCQQFEEFQRNLGVARNLLSSRLKYLQECGILKKVPAGKNSKRKEYKLSNKGMTLLPVIIALHQWGEQWLIKNNLGEEILDIDTLSKLAPMVPLNKNGEEVGFDQIRIIERAK